MSHEICQTNCKKLKCIIPADCAPLKIHPTTTCKTKLSKNPEWRLVGYTNSFSFHCCQFTSFEVQLCLAVHQLCGAATGGSVFHAPVGLFNVMLLRFCFLCGLYCSFKRLSFIKKNKAKTCLHKGSMLFLGFLKLI